MFSHEMEPLPPEIAHKETKLLSAITLPFWEGGASTWRRRRQQQRRPGDVEGGERTGADGAGRTGAADGGGSRRHAQVILPHPTLPQDKATSDRHHFHQPLKP